jgi:hypothetical protein
MTVGEIPLLQDDTVAGALQRAAVLGGDVRVGARPVFGCSVPLEGRLADAAGSAVAGSISVRSRRRSGTPLPRPSRAGSRRVSKVT